MAAMENDAVFAAEVDIDAAIQSEERGFILTDIEPEYDDEVNSEVDAPLLEDSDRRPSRGSPVTWKEDDEFASLPWWKKPSVFWLLPPFLIFTLAFGGMVVPKISLIMSLICREYLAETNPAGSNYTTLPAIFGEDNDQCRNPVVQSRIAQFTLYGNLISGILAAITSPKLGSLSDRHGRKKIMGLSVVGLLSAEIITIIAATYPDSVHVNWILLGYSLDGLFGSFISVMAVAHSYATDCTPPSVRNEIFGYFHGCLFTGIALGPIIAGYIIKGTGSVLSIFFIVLGTHALSIPFGALFIPESLSKARRDRAQEKRRLERLLSEPNSDWINQIRSLNLLEPLQILYPTGQGSSSALRRNLIFLASIDTIMFGVAMGSMTVVIIYVNLTFGWQTFEQTVFTSIVNTCRVVALVVVLPIVSRLVRSRTSWVQAKDSGSDGFDLWIIRFAVFFDMLGYLGYALSKSGNMFIMAGVIASAGGMGSATLQSALTKHVPADRVGQLLGAMGLLHALARVLGPTVFNGIYSVTVGVFPQAVFVCLTATFGLAFVCSWFIRPHVYLQDDSSAVSPQEH